MDNIVKMLRDKFGLNPFTAAEALAVIERHDLPQRTQWTALRNPRMLVKSFGHLLGDRPELDKHKTKRGNLYGFRE